MILWKALLASFCYVFCDKIVKLIENGFSKVVYYTERHVNENCYIFMFVEIKYDNFGTSTIYEIFNLAIVIENSQDNGISRG